MQKKLQIVFRGIDQSDAISSVIHKKVEKLERLHDNITSFRVVLDTPHKHHYKGKLFQVTVNAVTPDGDVNVSDGKEDMYLALRDVFNVIERQLNSMQLKRKSFLRTA